MDVFFETAFEVWGETFSWAEVIGALTGVICVWWVAREVIWNFPMGLANNVFLLVLFVLIFILFLLLLARTSTPSLSTAAPIPSEMSSAFRAIRGTLRHRRAVRRV